MARDFKEKARTAGVALLSTACFALFFLFVPHWLVVDLPVGSRAVRIGLAVGWVFVASWASAYAVARISGRVSETPEFSE